MAEHITGSAQNAPQFLSELVASNSEKLTKTDTRLLDVLMQNPFRAAMENGREVSFRAGVHPASAVRLARRLGFRGYPEFRAFLQSGLVEGGEDFEKPAARIAARLIRAEDGSLVSSVIDSEIAALETLRSSVSNADIRSFAEALRDARRIFIFGRSHATTLSHLIALRLMRSGYDACDLADAPSRIPEMLTGLRSDDVVWLIAFRQQTRQVQDIQRLAAAKGAKVLALTDMHGIRFNPAPDQHIAVSRGVLGDSQSLVVPMTVANMVILNLAAIDEGRSLRALEEYRICRGELPF